MKFKTTKSAIKAGFNTVLSIGYCDAQFLLYYKNPIAYSAGVYGWSCDYYDINGVCISTGYSPTGQKVNYTRLSVYEKMAQSIVCNVAIPYDTKVHMVDKLLTKLIDA